MLLALLLATCPAAPEAPPLLDRVAVVGASVSDGFMLAAEFGVDVDFADVLSAALPAGKTALGLGSNRMFLDPDGIGRQMIDEALEKRPSLVVAVDFLFWFGYGHEPGADARLRHLERGLALLDELPCALVVGDFPDMTPALEGTSPLGPLLAPGQIPAPATLERLNERVRAWVAERERVQLVSLDAFTREQRSGEPVVVHGNRWEPAAVEGLLQDDLLHPSVEGTIALALKVLDAVVTARGLDGDGITWDAEAVHARLLEAKAEELAEKREREQRREERRRAREERREAAGAGR